MGGHPIVTPVLETTSSLSPKTLNMGWSTDTETSCGDIVQFLSKNSQYGWSHDIDTSLSDNVEFLCKNTEYALVT